MRALKEWSAVVRALEDGVQCVILRKGGIHDAGPQGPFGGAEFALFPTHEHQEASSIRPEFRHYLEGGAPHGESFNTVGSLATVVAEAEVAPGPALDALSPMHIWSGEYVAKRAAWMPERPLRAALLRVRRISGERVSTGPEHAGCRSWIDVECSAAGGEAAMGDADAAAALEAFEGAVSR